MRSPWELTPFMGMCGQPRNFNLASGGFFLAGPLLLIDGLRLTPTEITVRITEIKTTDLPAVKAAIRALLTGDHSEYLLDTGQTTQRVKRLSLEELQAYQKMLNEELALLENSLGASGQIGRSYF